MKKQFNLQDWLKDKSQKVETRSGLPVRIICWDRRGERPLVVLIQHPNGYDEGLFCYENGLANGVGQESDSDLFLVTPEPELSEFEKKLSDVFGYAISMSVSDPPKPTDEFVREYAPELLAIARKELYTTIKRELEENPNGWVQRVEDAHNSWLKAGYKKGRAEALKEAKEGQERMIAEAANRGRMLALKELADYGHAQYKMGRDSVMQTAIRWRICENGACGNSKGRPIALVHRGGYRLVDSLGVTGEKYIMLSDLEKLPGFKDDE